MKPLLVLLLAAGATAQGVHEQLCTSSSQLITDPSSTPQVGTVTEWSNLVQTSAYTLSNGNSVVPGRIYNFFFVNSGATDYSLVADSGTPSGQGFATCANVMAHSTTTLFTWPAPASSTVIRSSTLLTR